MPEKRNPSHAPAKPASPKKAAAARANGAKSRGPLSPSGKVRSAMNAIRHGCYSNAILLVNEDPAAWEAHLQDFNAQFHPIGIVELGLVEEMAAAHWRMRRYWFAESATLDMEMTRQQPALDEKYELISEPARLSHAIEHFTSQPESQTLQFYHRIESRLRRHFSRSLSDLTKIQQMRLAPQPPALPPDPITTNDETNPPAPQPPTSQPVAVSQFKPVPNSYHPPSPATGPTGGNTLVPDRGSNNLPRNPVGSLL